MSRARPLAFGKKEEAIFLGREIAQHRDYSEDTAIHIDQEVRRIVTAATEGARNILENNRDTLERIARTAGTEVLDAVELKLLLENKPLPERSGPLHLRRRSHCPAQSPRPRRAPNCAPLLAFSKG